MHKKERKRKIYIFIKRETDIERHKNKGKERNRGREKRNKKNDNTMTKATSPVEVIRCNFGAECCKNCRRIWACGRQERYRAKVFCQIKVLQKIVPKTYTIFFVLFILMCCAYTRVWIFVCVCACLSACL